MTTDVMEHDEERAETTTLMRDGEVTVKRIRTNLDQDGNVSTVTKMKTRISLKSTSPCTPDRLCEQKTVMMVTCGLSSRLDVHAGADSASLREVTTG